MMNQWIKICHSSDLIADSGVCAQINDQQIAIFQLTDPGSVCAIGNWDPIGKANVLYRGIVGSSGDTRFVASPLYKQRFCLSSGECLDDQAIKVRVYPIKMIDQEVYIQITESMQ